MVNRIQNFASWIQPFVLPNYFLIKFNVFDQLVILAFIPNNYCYHSINSVTMTPLLIHWTLNSQMASIFNLLFLTLFFALVFKGINMYFITCSMHRLYIHHKYVFVVLFLFNVFAVKHYKITNQTFKQH